MFQGDQQWGPAPGKGSRSLQAGDACSASRLSQKSNIPSTAQPRKALQRQHGEGEDIRGQEQGSLYPARPRPMSPAGTANGKDKLAPALVLGRGRMSPGISPDPAEPRAGGDGLRSTPTSASCRDFLGICFQKLNSFAAPPFPASSCCLRSLQLHTQHNPALSPPSKGHKEQDAQSLSP